MKPQARLTTKVDRDRARTLSVKKQQAARQGMLERNAPPIGERFAEILQKFDTDGDGKLSDEEKEKIEEIQKAEMLEKFDQDGDGTLSVEERQAARQGMLERNAPPMGERFAEMLAKFDADGDGKLSDEERENINEIREAEMLEGFDQDGDGTLSVEERQAARQGMLERNAPPMGERFAEMLQKFDADGDGKLSDEERENINEIREAEMLEKFDKDGDGTLSVEERQAARQGNDKSNGHPRNSAH